MGDIFLFFYSDNTAYILVRNMQKLIAVRPRLRFLENRDSGFGLG